MDTHTAQQRSYNMSRITSENTQPEILFRRYIWNKGVKGYRLHVKLQGKPDLYFPKKKVAVFIDGCFWHRCPECFIKPKSNNDYWDAKIKMNVLRDKTVNKSLETDNIKVVRIWEHEIKNNLQECLSRLSTALR